MRMSCSSLSGNTTELRKNTVDHSGNAQEVRMMALDHLGNAVDMDI